MWRALAVMFVLLLSAVAVDTALAQSAPDPAGIVACWDMDEASGVRYDTVNNYDLTDNNTVGSSAGLVGTSANFVSANSEFLTNSSLSFSTFSIMTIFKASSSGVIHTLAMKGNNSSNVTPEFMLRVDGTAGGAVELTISNGTTYGGVGGGSNIDDGAYHVIGATYNAGVVSVFADGNVYNGTTTGKYTNAAPFSLGGSSSGIRYTNGQLDTTFIYSGTLTTDEMNWFYDGGNGRSCDELATMGAVTVASYTVDLPSGGSGVVDMTMTAGDFILIAAVTLLVLFNAYSYLEKITRGAKPK